MFLIPESSSGYFVQK